MTATDIKFYILLVAGVILLLLVAYYLMTMDTPDKPEHEFDSARRKMMKVEKL